MKPGGARSKGQEGEREVIRLLAPIVEEVCGQESTLSRNLNQTREGGHDIVGLDWLAIEVKRQETLDVENWWRQTLRQAGDKREPVLIYRQNRKSWHVVMWAKVGEHRCRATISLQDFQDWFRLTLKTMSRTDGFSRVS